jgi:hypothetical protein
LHEGSASKFRANADPSSTGLFKWAVAQQTLVSSLCPGGNNYIYIYYICIHICIALSGVHPATECLPPLEVKIYGLVAIAIIIIILADVTRLIIIVVFGW